MRCSNVLCEDLQALVTVVLLLVAHQNNAGAKPIGSRSREPQLTEVAGRLIQDCYIANVALHSHQKWLQADLERNADSEQVEGSSVQISIYHCLEVGGKRQPAIFFASILKRFLFPTYSEMDGVPQDDGLKWFGEGFDGFPKRLPEDCVEYVVYAINQTLEDALATRTRLTQISKSANDLTKKHLKDYIWQRDSFELKLYPNPTTQLHDKRPPIKDQTIAKTPHLHGRTNFGDSVADEWLIVYLLVELSKQCREAWIRVYDTDGEFLLIEAANALPKWLNPDIAENRVWINNGHLRIIPLDADSQPRNLPLPEALKFIGARSDKLIITPFIEDAAFSRLREYPSAIATSLHYALTTIPRRLAYMLHSKAAYISPAVEAFYLRDPIALKPLATKDTATLSFPPEDFVTVSVAFTKVGYAQLRSQLFDTPPSWTGVIPRLQDSKVEMGMKLACGFEMMVSDPQNRDQRVVREIQLLLEDVESGEESLPTDVEVEGWVRRQDDEKWLDIDYSDFEKELSGSKDRPKKGGDGIPSGQNGAQENLRKMVSRFEDFLEDDDAGTEGVDDDEDLEDEDEEGTPPSDDDDSDASMNEADFGRAMKQTQAMPSSEVDKSGLLAEARRLALEDAEDGSEVDEDEEMRKVMDLMEKELTGHGALKLDADEKLQKTAKASGKPVFGPEKPPHMHVKKDATATVDDDEDVGPGDGELSSDDEEFNDIDLGLAKNMLESFKGQAGMAGPAGNMMRALGINMPRDEGEGEADEDRVHEVA